MKVRPDHSEDPPARDHDRRGCPALIDLAALAEGGLADADAERIELHVARCAVCFEALLGLRREADDIVDESRRLLVPSDIVTAAMNLRETPASDVVIVRSRQRWMLGTRRALAAAAGVAIAVAGYQVGQSLTQRSVAQIASTASDDNSESDLFALLDDSTTADEEDDLFTLAFSSAAIADAPDKEASQ